MFSVRIAVVALLLVQSLIGLGQLVAPESAFAVGRTVNVVDAAELIAAMRDLQADDTIVLAAGTYDVERQLGDMSFGGQAGWYFPIWQSGVTIRGAGTGLTMLTSSVDSANGAWASQDFISVWANGVTVEGMTVVSKIDTNKAIEVMGKDFTLRDMEFLTNPRQNDAGLPYDPTGPFYKFSGSVYFNPVVGITGATGDVGTSRLENVFLEASWLSAIASVVTTGAIDLSDVTLDWVEGGYAPWGYGMMSANPLIHVENDVTFIVDDTMSDFASQVSARLPIGGVIEFATAVADPSTEVTSAVFTKLKRDGSYPTTGTVNMAFGDPMQYAWTFPIASLDPSFEATFYPGVAVRTTVTTDVEDMVASDVLPTNGDDVVELDFAHVGELPGPAQVKASTDPELAGTKFRLFKYDAEAADPLVPADQTVIADEDGYVTVSITSGDLWYLVQVPTYTVTFVDFDGSVIATQAVEEGSDAVAPADPERAGHTFTGWDVAFTDISGDLEVTATYSKGAVTHIRHAGQLRYDTAALAAKTAFPDGANAAVLAYSKNFPDALAASTLAGVIDGPIMLTDTSELSAQAAETFEALGVETVYIVGGTHVVSQAIEDELAKSYSVVRLAGIDRYTTAKVIADEAVRLGASDSEAFLVRGDKFADALAVSSIAAQQDVPVLLTRTNVLSVPASDFIEDNEVSEVYVAGGTAAVSQGTAASVATLGATVTRWDGSTRYETAAKVVSEALDVWSIEFARIGLASGANFPDALTGGAAMGAKDGLLLLSAPDTLSAATETLIGLNEATVYQVEYFGGTSALSNAVSDAVKALLN